LREEEEQEVLGGLREEGLGGFRQTIHIYVHIVHFFVQIFFVYKNQEH
jgi:hypothetical protein